VRVSSPGFHQSTDLRAIYLLPVALCKFRVCSLSCMRAVRGLAAPTAPGRPGCLRGNSNVVNVVDCVRTAKKADCALSRNLNGGIPSTFEYSCATYSSHVIPAFQHEHVDVRRESPPR
jgi:hypothetical protein